MANPPHEKQAIKEVFRKQGLTAPCGVCGENDYALKEYRTCIRDHRRDCKCCHVCKPKCKREKQSE